MSREAEPTPPDRLEGFPHPREVTALYGHEAAQRTFLEAFSHERLHHAWLLSGPEGIGKSTLAYRIAAYVLSHGVRDRDGALPVCLRVDPDQLDVQLVAGGSHPNMLVLRRMWNEKSKQFFSSILIDDVRELQRFLGTTAGKGRWRVVIIDTADDLNVSAANALLKMLEEPPIYCLFLLISSQPGRLPVTIRSRCRKLRLEPLADEHLQQALAAIAHQAGIDLPGEDRLGPLRRLADGSVRLTLELVKEGASATSYGEIRQVLDLLPKIDPLKTVQFAERFAARSSEHQYETFMTIFMAQLASRIRHSALNAKGDARALALWAELWETVSTMRHDVDRLNLDRGNFVIDLFARLEDVARRAGGLKG